jgi:hypothetical protein
VKIVSASVKLEVLREGHVESDLAASPLKADKVQGVVQSLREAEPGFFLETIGLAILKKSLDGLSDFLSGTLDRIELGLNFAEVFLQIPFPQINRKHNRPDRSVHFVCDPRG